MQLSLVTCSSAFMPVTLLTIRACGGCGDTMIVPALMVSTVPASAERGIGVVLARCCWSAVFRLQPIMERSNWFDFHVSPWATSRLNKNNDNYNHRSLILNCGNQMCNKYQADNLHSSFCIGALCAVCMSDVCFKKRSSSIQRWDSWPSPVHQPVNDSVLSQCGRFGGWLHQTSAIKTDFLCCRKFKVNFTKT